MSSVEKFLNQAESWLGLNESDGSHMEIINAYNDHSPLARGYKVKNNDNWCATFVSACAIKTGLTDVIPLECSCGNMINLAKNMGIWNEDGSIVPNPGDIIMYDWDKADSWPEHVGIIKSASNGNIKVIEGNKNDSVAYRTIEVGNASIRGYIQPKYDQVVSQPTPSVPESVPENDQNKVLYQVKVSTPSGVNCRSGASTASVKITAFANNTVLDVYKESNEWLFVNNIGWVCGTYCTKISNVARPTGTYKVTASDLIVRDAPNGKAIGHARLSADGKKHDKDKDGALDKGTKVSVLKWHGDWAEIPSGFVHGDYLVKV